MWQMFVQPEISFRYRVTEALMLRFTHTNSCITESHMSRLSAKQNGHQNSKLLKNHAMCVQINLKAALLYITAIPVELNLRFVETRGKKEIWLKMVLS
jgi:hypothetical protein